MASSRAEPRLSLAELKSEIEILLGDGGSDHSLPTAGDWTALRALYQNAKDAPLWFDATGRVDRNAGDALSLLGAAAEEGLEPGDYAQNELARLATVLRGESPAGPADAARFDVALTSAMLRYLRQLHEGRVDPRLIGFRLVVPTDAHDFGAMLAAALAEHRLPETAMGLWPQLGQYRALRSMLTRYRSLAATTALEQPMPSTMTVRPGDPYAGVGVLHRRLLALGDFPADVPVPPEPAVYDGTLVESVKRFQVRHGLEPDGILGARTLAALQVPLAWRVRQIELALERLRWLPDLGDERLVVVNIPMFRLWAWDAVPLSGPPSFSTDVVVGRALGTQTPVFAEEMREVIFRPYWNVPRSILRNEILPMIARDAGALGRRNMEIVRGEGDDAQPVAMTAESVARLREGALRVRQRPGPENALGLVKFVFPNEENIYMHGTPEQELFTRSRRDFSHGCVRVRDPVRLAEWALGEETEWNRERILASMAGPQPLRVTLRRPIEVILFYTTAAVMPEDGTIRFADDIYGHDGRLDRALARRPVGR